MEQKNIMLMEIKDDRGKVICYYPELIHQTNKLMNTTYKLLMVKLEKSGMLTKKHIDPSMAMSKFGGS